MHPLTGAPGPEIEPLETRELDAIRVERARMRRLGGFTRRSFPGARFPSRADEVNRARMEQC
jgi:hypothetical protein